MKNPLISILIVNYNSSDFVENSLFALEKLTKNSYRVFIADNDSKLHDFRKLLKLQIKYKNIFIERNVEKLRGSMAHGTALNQLVKKVDTKYFCILDADAVWLKKDWDEILIRKMSDKIKVIGTQSIHRDGRDFPSMFAIIFETETFLKLNIDLRPKDMSTEQDTGWEMRGKYLKDGYQAMNLEFKNTRVYKNGPFRKTSGIGEFYLEKDYDNLFATHFGRGSNPFAKRVIKINNGLINLIFLPINYLFCKKEKVKWIRICKKIAIQQKTSC